jgi:hypothetical protein
MQHVEVLLQWQPSPHAGIEVVVTACAGTGHVGQDAWFAAPMAGGWRLAAIDGVTPHPHARQFAGADAAVWATAVIQAALRAPGSTHDALVAANAQLWDSAIHPSRAQSTACVVAAEAHVSDAGLSGSVVSAGDCEAWVRTGSEITRLVGGENVFPRSKAEWEAALASNVAWENIDLESQVIDGPEHRRTDTVGRYEHLRVELATFAGCDELILASDGACLGEWATSGVSLDEWLASVAARASRDDLTVVRAHPVLLPAD